MLLVKVRKSREDLWQTEEASNEDSMQVNLREGCCCGQGGGEGGERKLHLD